MKKKRQHTKNTNNNKHYFIFNETKSEKP